MLMYQTKAAFVDEKLHEMLEACSVVMLGSVYVSIFKTIIVPFARPFAFRLDGAYCALLFLHQLKVKYKDQQCGFY